MDLDEEFRENHMSLLERFYKLFDSIYRYVHDLKTYWEEMMEGQAITYDTLTYISSSWNHGGILAWRLEWNYPGSGNVKGWNGDHWICD